ncbi:hypothetical protein DUI87_22372 [Hirundo rustica rustica]|uniref:Helicase C-terminal domain-containing protein n=1 Tax=Hirundo rustica rustica TaxID=333673 RepID=A0A3M0JJF4_HIRRU|nr:hypothetical protein DUI87_22372 [Hirundo rustica rustica]
MSRPRNVPPRQHGGGAASSGAPAAPGRGRGGRGLRDIRVDEEVEIAVNLSLERFRYGEDAGHYLEDSGCDIIFENKPKVILKQLLSKIITQRYISNDNLIVTHFATCAILRVSPKTLVTFCTNGILLRTLMAGDSTLSTVTHVIVKSLRKAYIDVVQFQGRPFEVKEMFLEDILRSTGYTEKEMVKYKKEKQQEEKQQSTLTEWCSAQENNSKLEPGRPRSVPRATEECDDGHTVFNQLTEKDVNCLELWLTKEMDSCLSDIWLHKDIDAFAQVFHLILTENVSVDYRHSETSATALMIASGRGFLSQVEQLISMGADIHCRSSNGWMAVDWAKHFGQTEVVALLESYSASAGFGNLDESSLVRTSGSDLSAEDRELLTAYHHRFFDDEKVDLDLIMHLLYNICHSCESGAILVFLPGYDEIVSLRDRILFDDRRFADNAHRYQVFMLHSNMQTLDQKKVLKSPPLGMHKIILSTNIAGTSITASDVVFVIDSGKVKEKSFDALSCVTMLKMVWISKASAIQRKGRAGCCQPGVCFRLFSRLRFENMLEFQTPELLRMPLQELCLHTKLQAPINCPVVDFLMKAPDPPPALIVENALQMLKTVDAMDPWEDLTKLGYHLTELPVEPHLGKMVLCAVVLKCLDPVLTIACALAYRDPFVLPTLASQKRAAMLCRKRFTAGTFSDHTVLLRAFQAWQKAHSGGWEKAFCKKNFLSQATMQIIVGMRTQLLGQLRASGFVRARGGADIRDVNANSENWAVVKAALVAGMYPNLVHVDRENLVLTAPKEKKCNFILPLFLVNLSIKRVLMKSTHPMLHQPKKYKQKSILYSKQTSDDRSDCSSVKSADSSSFPSPCASPSFPISGKGFARMGSSTGCEKSQDWGSAGFGGVFKVEWIRKESVPFQFAHHLLNPWNDNKKVQISRDGQELEPQAGEQLLQLWDHIPSE